MDIRASFKSTYLKASDIPEGQFVPVTIDRIEEANMAQEGHPADNKPVMYFVGKEKGMVLNKTNSEAVAAAFGYETDDWTGKRISLYITATNTPDGKPCMGLRISIPKNKPIKGAASAKPAPLPPQPAYEGEAGESAGPGTPDDSDIPFAANKY